MRKIKDLIKSKKLRKVLKKLIILDIVVFGLAGLCKVSGVI